MTQAHMERNVSARGFTLKETLSLEQSLERYVRRTWPFQPAANVQKAWGLRPNQAREVLRGRASKQVLEQIAARSCGDYTVLLAIFEPVVGRPFAQWYAEQRGAFA